MEYFHLLFLIKKINQFFVRDHVGEPFYYFQDNNFIVSSELKPLVEINKAV